MMRRLLTSSFLGLSLAFLLAASAAAQRPGVGGRPSTGGGTVAPTPRPSVGGGSPSPRPSVSPAPTPRPSLGGSGGGQRPSIGGSSRPPVTAPTPQRPSVGGNRPSVGGSRPSVGGNSYPGVGGSSRSNPPFGSGRTVPRTGGVGTPSGSNPPSNRGSGSTATPTRPQPNGIGGYTGAGRGGVTPAPGSTAPSTGTNRGSSLYRGSYERPSVRSNPGVKTGGDSRPAPGTAVTPQGDSRSRGDGFRGLSDPGKTNEGARRYPGSEVYRSKTDERLSGNSGGDRGRVPAAGSGTGSASPLPGSPRRDIGRPALPGGNNRIGGADNGGRRADGRGDRSGSTGARDFRPVAGRPSVAPSDRGAARRSGAVFVDVHSHDRYYHRRHSDRLHVNFFFGSYGFGLGFGYYGGHCYNPFYWNNGYYFGHCYRSYWHCRSWWYPYYGSCWYPYYWSYSYYPAYRVNYVYHVYETGSRPVYTSTGYYAGAGYDDDPYADEDVVYTGGGVTSLAPETPAPVAVSGGDRSFSTPFKEGLAVGSTFEQAMEFGDAALKRGEALEAAEAYRQAWQIRQERATLQRMSLALFLAGDYAMSSVSLVMGIDGSEKAMLDHAVLMSDLLGGTNVRKATEALERYLVDNPNDEGANLLLGSTYVLSGKEYAGYLLLSRLRSAGFETKTCDLFIEQARTAMAR